MITVDVSTRLRQAILSGDLPLVKRILKSNPTCLRNPDYSDKSNTSLHLAAQHGLTDITEHLLSLGHDEQPPATEYMYQSAESTSGTSFNTDGHTPLHLAASHNRTSIVELLCDKFSYTVNKKDNEGCTALHLAARGNPPPSAMTFTPASRLATKAQEDTSTIEVLLATGANVYDIDNNGNTCLHYATAWGNLKTVRALIQAGADPLCANLDGWTPEYYSVTVQAEVYYRNLIAEYEKRKMEETVRMRELKSNVVGAVRLVDSDDGDSDKTESEGSRSRADSGTSQAKSVTDGGLGISIRRTESWK